jgi:hypothetical protein
VTLDLALLALAILLGITTITALVAAADRHARAIAWRQIALERRWNHDHIHHNR